jgi:F-type H+-transporting ATPase subunit gamma
LCLLGGAEGQESDLVVIGEKGRAQLQRDQASHIKETIADVGKLRITFAQARAAPHRRLTGARSP